LGAVHLLPQLLGRPRANKLFKEEVRLRGVEVNRRFFLRAEGRKRKKRLRRRQIGKELRKGKTKEVRGSYNSKGKKRRRNCGYQRNTLGAKKGAPLTRLSACSGST